MFLHKCKIYLFVLQKQFVHIFLNFRYVPAALECSRDASGIEKSAAVSGGGFSFHDMFEHAHNLHPNGNENGSRHNQH